MLDQPHARPWYSAPVAGERLGCGTAIYHHLQRGRLPGWRVNGKWRVDALAVDALAAMAPEARRLTMGHLPQQLAAARERLLHAMAEVDRLLLALVAATSPAIQPDQGNSHVA